MTREFSDKRFSLLKTAGSFAHAGRGIWVFLKWTHNAWIQILILCGAVLLGFHFSISRVDWMLLVLAAGLVLAAEAFNTAVEMFLDIVSPEYHPYVRNAKDVAAGAVLISAVAAGSIGLLIFYP